MTRPPRDRGSATVWLAVWSLLPVLVATAALGMAAAVATRHRAAAASDAAALAAAARLDEGVSRACAVAADIAARQGAKLTLCASNGEFVDIVAEFPPPPMLQPFGAPRAAARAGPG